MNASTWFMAALLVLAAGVALLGLASWIRSQREDRSAATLSSALQPREAGREADAVQRDSLGWLERFGQAVGGGRVEAALLASEDRL
ncbi:type II secretion system F family protein, partial [Stenotrophomonas sp. NPDC077659]